MSEVNEELINLIADMEEDEAVEPARQSLDDGMEPAAMVEVCRKYRQY
jgi:methanogenic corrinoid protein MtbC1